MANETFNLTQKNLQISIVWKLINELLPHKGNARTHSSQQLEKLSKSIKNFGFNNPILLDQTDRIVAGHGRVEAAKRLGMSTVPTICLSHMTKEQIRAYIIADNRLAELADWDHDLLKLEFDYLANLDIDFNMTLTGFDQPEIDLILSEDDNKQSLDENFSNELPINPVSQVGDLWLLGKHKILCGDALESSTFETLMGSEKAQVIFTDPPYNVPINGHVSGKGVARHSEFFMASGEMSLEEFTEFLKHITKNLVQFSTNGSLHYICMDWRHMRELLDAAREYSELKNLCVWNKTNGGMGSFYRSKHELVFVFKNGTGRHTNNIELGKHGRYRTNVWDYAGTNSFEKDRQKELAMHPTVKPVAMIKDALLDSSKHHDIVLDCFGGSGSTLIAAEKIGRHARLIELDPKYVDITLLRFQAVYGLPSIHQQTGKTYEQMKEERHG